MNELEELKAQVEKLSREVFGLKQTIKNMQRAKAKKYDYANGEYNPDANYLNKYHGRHR